MKSLRSVHAFVALCAGAALPAALYAQAVPQGPVSFAAAIPHTEARLDLPPDDPSIPLEVLDLMRRSQLRYQDGATLIKGGETVRARAAFDEAVDLILKSAWSLHEQPALDRFFHDLIQRIQEDESRFSREKDADEAAESAVVDELEKLDLIPITVDPALKDVVEADLANTRYDIPVMLNERVLKSLDYWLHRGRQIFTDGLMRSGRYREMIQKTFREASLPLDLMYLAQVESLFKTNALSRAQCKGIWQFGKWTAMRYGLKVTSIIDERSDPEKSTRAAARYLNDLHEMFQDWNLVLAAYNWGEGKVQRLMSRSGLSDFWDLADLGRRRNLPAETKNHVPLIMSSIILARNPEKYGLPTELERPLPHDRVPVDHPIDLRAAARVLGVAVEELKELNPELRGYTTPPGYPGYSLKIPPALAADVTAQLTSLPVAKPQPAYRAKRHKVRPGETLSQIAGRYRVSVAKLQAQNNVTSSRQLRAGMWLEIPSAARSVRSQSARSRTPRRSSASTAPKSASGTKAGTGSTKAPLRTAAAKSTSKKPAQASAAPRKKPSAPTGSQRASSR